MSNHAKHRPPAVPTLRPPRLEPETGRFRVGHGQAAVGSTIVPPSGGVELAEVSLDSLGAILELDGPETAQRPAEVGGTPGKTSGVYATAQQQADAAELEGLGDIISSSRPYYEQQEAPVERAQLEFEDLSLRLDSLYAASSLVPPPRKPVQVGKLLAAAGAAATAVGAALLLWSQPPVPVTTAVESSKHLLPLAAPMQSPAQAEVQVAVTAPVVAPVEMPAAVAKLAPQAPADLAVAPVVRAVSAPVEAVAIKAAPLASAAPTRPPTEPSAVAVEDHAAPTASTPSQADSATAQAQVAEVAATATAEPGATVVAVPVAVAPAATLAPVASSEAADLPEIPSREAVTLGFENIRDQITSCAAGKHGIVMLNATIASRGRLAGVLVDGIFKGTPEGSCMARAARSASFPPFSQSTLKVSYPLSI